MKSIPLPAHLLAKRAALLAAIECLTHAHRFITPENDLQPLYKAFFRALQSYPHGLYAGSGLWSRSHLYRADSLVSDALSLASEHRFMYLSYEWPFVPPLPLSALVQMLQKALEFIAKVVDYEQYQASIEAEKAVQIAATIKGKAKGGIAG